MSALSISWWMENSAKENTDRRTKQVHYQRQKPKADKHPQKSHLQSHSIHSTPDGQPQNSATSNEHDPYFVEGHFVFVSRSDCEESWGESRFRAQILGPRLYWVRIASSKRAIWLPFVPFWEQVCWEIHCYKPLEALVLEVYQCTLMTMWQELRMTKNRFVLRYLFKVKLRKLFGCNTGHGYNPKACRTSLR